MESGNWRSDQTAFVKHNRVQRCKDIESYRRSSDKRAALIPIHEPIQGLLSDLLVTLGAKLSLAHPRIEESNRMTNLACPTYSEGLCAPSQKHMKLRIRKHAEAPPSRIGHWSAKS